MKKLTEILLIPVKNNIQMWIACYETWVDFSISCIDLDFSELEFYAFHHDGVVAVVIEKHYVSSVFERVCLV